MEFIYQKLDVWQKAVELSLAIMKTIGQQRENAAGAGLIREIEASATRVATCIARGKACYYRTDFIRHLNQARSALYETMTLLEIFRRRGWISDEAYQEFEKRGNQITAMLVRLIKTVTQHYNPAHSQTALAS